jgi:putative oxidoreductase
MLESTRDPLAFIGRLMLASMFLISGAQKLLDVGATASYIQSAGLPLASTIAVLVGLWESLGGLALATGFYTRPIAFAFGIFTIGVTFVFHRFWEAPPELQTVVQLLFIKNVAIAGGLFFLAGRGAGAISLDERRR